MIRRQLSSSTFCRAPVAARTALTEPLILSVEVHVTGRATSRKLVPFNQLVGPAFSALNWAASVAQSEKRHICTARRTN